MRIALISDTHLSSRSPECVANWHAARRAVERLGADLSIHLGDITLDGRTRAEELEFASRLLRQWPTEMRCVPGNHDLGDGSGEEPLDSRLRRAYGDIFGADRWLVRAGDWQLLGIDAQLLGSDSPQEAELWRWLEGVAAQPGPAAHTALLLHRPVWRPFSDRRERKGRYVTQSAAQRLLGGVLQPTLRLVASGHTHQYLDLNAAGVLHLWMPSTAYVLPDETQAPIGEKRVGIGLLELGDGDLRFDLWCPDGMTRHDVSKLKFIVPRAAATLASSAG
jgi:3',5'-cyclic AMP phosphodiesterase CpdA